MGSDFLVLLGIGGGGVGGHGRYELSVSVVVFASSWRSGGRLPDSFRGGCGGSVGCGGVVCLGSGAGLVLWWWWCVGTVIARSQVYSSPKI